MTLYHMHHIIPKHAGGTDISSNLEKLTVPEHAEAHRKLWEEHGRIQDYAAWKALSNNGLTSELISLLTKEGMKKVIGTPEYSERQRYAVKCMWAKPGMKEHLRKKRREQSAMGKNPMQGKKQKKVCCLICKNEFGVNAIKNHQTKCKW